MIIPSRQLYDIKRVLPVLERRVVTLTIVPVSERLQVTFPARLTIFLSFQLRILLTHTLLTE